MVGALGALAVAVVALLPGCAVLGASAPRHTTRSAALGTSAPRRTTRTVARCSWSYFGDARAVVFHRHVFTACIGVDGGSLVEDYDPASGRRRLRRVFAPLEVDDHNNPSLVVFRGQLMAFSSPHSGYRFPLDRRSRMRYRTLTNPTHDRWGTVHSVPLRRGCGLGYTYPNPVATDGRLYLFMRGPCWEPYFTWTADGRSWAEPRTLVRAPRLPPRPSGWPARRVRPYGKYAAADDGGVLIALSDGHPALFKSSLFFAELRRDGIYGADGRRIAGLRNLPVDFDRLDGVHDVARDGGRAWPMDVAAGRDGRPVIVYTALHGVRDTFRYAWYGPAGWQTRRIAAAGRSLFTYHNSGATLDHADPSRLVLSRTIAGQNEIELDATADSGSTWRRTPVTTRSAAFNIRPVIPRGEPAGWPTIVLWVAGSARSFREYNTSVLMRVAPPARPQRSR